MTDCARLIETLERRGVCTTNPMDREECCGLPRDEDGFCTHREGHPIYVNEDDQGGVDKLIPLLAEVRRGRALREAVEGLAETWEADADRHGDAEPVSADGLMRMVLAERFARMNAADLRAALAATDGGDW